MKNKALKITLSVILAALLLAAAFVGGFFTHKLTQNAQSQSLQWFIDTVDKNYYFGNAEDGYTQTSLKAIAAQYLDRYSAYYTAEEYQSLLKSNAGSKSGVGISYSYISGKGVYIRSVTGNSPAYMSGLRAGETLSGGSADGKEVTFKSSNDLLDLINSVEAGQPVTLYSTDGKREYEMARAEYTASYTSLCTNGSGWTFETAADGGLYPKEYASMKMPFLPDGAAYISISQFYGTADKEFKTLMRKYNAMKCDTLILDLRSNGGGYIDVMQSIAGCFAGGEQKTALIARDKNGGEKKYDCEKITDPNELIGAGSKVYVLANSDTASASEALIGAMICYGCLDYKNIFLSDYSEEYIDWLKSTKQEVKTARSYGKGIMQTTFVNGGTGEALKLTTAKIFWPDGVTSIHDRGLTADDGCRTVAVGWQHTLPDSELMTVAEIISE